jgi:dTDP-4-amino-4,6-dideoxygalactose transaminase
MIVGTELIPPARPYFPQPDIEEMKTHLEKILTSRMQTLGEYAKQFEQMFATIAQAKRAVAVNSGTSALEIALRT